MKNSADRSGYCAAGVNRDFGMIGGGVRMSGGAGWIRLLTAKGIA